MNNRSTDKHSFGHWLLFALTALILTACGGDNELPLAPGTGGGTTTPPPVVESNPAFSFSVPAASAEIEVSTPTPVSVTYLDNAGAPKAGETVYFTTSRGILSAPSATTDASGKATVTVNSTSAGPASIKANTTGGSQTAIRTVLFVSKTPASISLQAESTTLAKGGSTAITATVLDSSGNTVKGAIVGFTLISDSSGGQLSDPTATTDTVGKASITYTAGNLTTATNGVAIRATVQGSSPTITTNSATTGPAPLDATLTVSGSAMSIALTTGNTITEKDPTRYALPVGIQVTDNVGRGVANVTVTLSVIPTEYYKGEYVWNGTDLWVATSSAGACSNEDANLNDILDPGEDFNGNDMLEPKKPVSVPLPVTTDADGLASFSVIYGKNFAHWIKVRLKATASVAGSESVVTKDFVPPAMSTDVSDKTKAPPGGGNSPFGTATDCADPL